MRMDSILESHVIEPAVLRSDDFLAFFRAREKALLDRVEAAMGKPIARDLVQPEVDDLGDYEDEGEPEKWSRNRHRRISRTSLVADSRSSNRNTGSLDVEVGMHDGQEEAGNPQVRCVQASRGE